MERGQKKGTNIKTCQCRWDTEWCMAFRCEGTITNLSGLEGNDHIGGGTQLAENYKFRAAIVLYGTINGAFSPLGTLFFHKDPKTLPASDLTPPDGQPVVSHFAISDYENVVELLRSGELVFCNHRTNVAFAWLSSGTLQKAMRATDLIELSAREGVSTPKSDA